MTSIEARGRVDGTIEPALGVLREASASRLQGPDTRRRAGALGAAWPLRRHWLVAFWEAAESNHDIGRSQGLHAAYNGIVRQMRSNAHLIK